MLFVIGAPRRRGICQIKSTINDSQVRVITPLVQCHRLNQVFVAHIG